jgi:hypothetical protein
MVILRKTELKGEELLSLVYWQQWELLVPKLTSPLSTHKHEKWLKGSEIQSASQRNLIFRASSSLIILGLTDT